MPLRLSYEELTTREKSQRQGGSLDRTAELQTCKVIINKNAHALYSMRMRTHSCRRPHNCYMERSEGSYTGVTGSRTTVTCRGHRGHTHESQAAAQLLHAEFTGVTRMSHRHSHNCYMESSQGSQRGRKIIK